MSMHDDVAATLRLVQQNHNARAWAALAGMLAMFGGMVALMWFLSQPVMAQYGWGFGALSVAGLVLWRSMLSASRR